MAEIPWQFPVWEPPKRAVESARLFLMVKLATPEVPRQKESDHVTRAFAQAAEARSRARDSDTEDEVRSGEEIVLHNLQKGDAQEVKVRVMS